MTSASPLLDVRHLAKSFGGVEAVRDVSFTVAAGELVALIGPNGAGKTTCFNLVNGQLSPDRGEVLLAGKSIAGLSPREIAAMGVGRTFQVAATFASMTVRENVELALLAHVNRHRSLFSSMPDARRPYGSDAHSKGHPASGDDVRACANRNAVTADMDDVQGAALALLERVRMGRFADQGCATLAYGDAKRVELALALAGAPQLLLMDEPTAGMSPRSRDRVMHVAAELARAENIAVLFTEHDMDVVFGYADRIVVLDRGEIIAAGTPDVIRADARVQAVYLGTDT